MLLHGRVLGRLMTDVDSQTLVRHIGLSWSQQIRQTEEQVGRQHQGMDRLGVRQVPEGSGEQEKKNWRKLVVKSFVVPQRPSSWLRDR